MKQWRNVGIPVAVAVLVAAVIFRFGSGSYMFHELSAWAVGLFSSVSVYVVFGHIERRFTRAAQEIAAENPVRLIRALFRRSPGLVQLLRLALTVYVGALAHALAYNAMFSPFAMRNISVGAGIVAASLVGTLLYLREANPPPQDGPIR